MYVYGLLTDNKPLQNMVKLKYLGKIQPNQNRIHEETKGRLNAGNAWYHSVQNILSSSLLSKNIRIKIYTPTILPETWPLVWRNEWRLKVCKNRVQRSKGKNQETHDICKIKNFMCDWIKDEMGGACCTYGTEKKCIHRFVRETERKETTWKKPGVEGMIKIK